jgi:hypothetical protein
MMPNDHLVFKQDFLLELYIDIEVWIEFVQIPYGDHLEVFDGLDQVMVDIRMLILGVGKQD